MKPGYVEKEKMVKPSLEGSAAHRQLNGRPKMPRVDSFSRFSDPPAPPPQQPLPEKPEGLEKPASFPSLKRSDTEKARGGTGSSSQILSLIEELSLARREIDLKEEQVKGLQKSLSEERNARKLAEERVSELENPATVENKDAIANDKNLNSDNIIGDNGQMEMEDTVQVNGIPPSESSSAEDGQLGVPLENKTAELEDRLNAMMQEMEALRQQMELSEGRAQQAENSATQMAETLRHERESRALQTSSDSKSNTLDHGPAKVATGHLVTSESSEKSPTHITSPVHEKDSAPSPDKVVDADIVTTFATQHHRSHYVEEASPYASIFGVVLLGVGLMAYLNGWQKMDK